ncbi:hypothetical protein YC2023_047831 [Brassica napus]
MDQHTRTRDNLREPKTANHHTRKLQPTRFVRTATSNSDTQGELRPRHRFTSSTAQATAGRTKRDQSTTTEPDGPPTRQIWPDLNEISENNRGETTHAPTLDTPHHRSRTQPSGQRRRR